MAKICPCTQRSTKGKPKPTSKTIKATQTQLQQQKNKQLLEKKDILKQQQSSEDSAQKASPNSTIIDPTKAQLERQFIEQEKREREVLHKACNEDNKSNNTAGRSKKKKKKRARKAAPTHQAQPTSSPPPPSSLDASSDIRHVNIEEANATETATLPVQEEVVAIKCITSVASSESIQPASSTSSSSPSLGASSDIPHVHVQAVGSTKTATQAVQAVVSIESTPSVASQSPSTHQQPQQLDEATLTFLAQFRAYVEEGSRKMKEGEDEMTTEALMKMGIDDIYNMCEPTFQESYRLSEGVVKFTHSLDVLAVTMVAALERQHPDEKARTIASMRVKHEQELQQHRADHCKRTAEKKEAMRTAHQENKEAMRTAHREDRERAAREQERIVCERKERERASKEQERASKEQERMKRAAEKDAWHQRVDAVRRESARKYALMVEEGHRLDERCRLGPLIRSRRGKHFADAG